MRSPAIVIHVSVASHQYSGSARSAATHAAGKPVEPYDKDQHNISESQDQRVRLEGMSLPTWGYTFVTVD